MLPDLQVRQLPDWLYHPIAPTIAASLFAATVGILALYIVSTTLWEEQAAAIDQISALLQTGETHVVADDIQRSVAMRNTQMAREQVDLRACAAERDCCTLMNERLTSFLGSVAVSDVSSVVDAACRRKAAVARRLADGPGFVVVQPAVDGNALVGATFVLTDMKPRPGLEGIAWFPEAIALIGLFAAGSGFLAYHWSYTTRARIEQLLRAAAFDGLTRVLRRETFMQELGAGILRANGAGTLSVLVIDVDRLKPTNDSFGHSVGDAVLRLVAECVRDAVRSSDVVGRLGGDEFAALMIGTTAAQAAALAERVREEVERRCAVVHGKPTNVTVSIGVAELKPGDDAPSLVERADLRLYTAKRGSRNCVVVIG